MAPIMSYDYMSLHSEKLYLHIICTKKPIRWIFQKKISVVPFLCDNLPQKQPTIGGECFTG